MTALQHAYLTAHGSYISGPWVGEAAQFGMRLAFESTNSMPGKGTIFTLSTHGNVASDQGQLAGTHGMLSRTWTARLGPAPSAENINAAYQLDLFEDLWTFLNAIKTYTYPNFAWSHMKLAPVDAAGATQQTSSVYTLTAPLAGTGTSALPPQCAMAVTLRANILGRRGRGRFYLPALAGGTITGDGVLTTTATNAVRAATVTLVDALQNVPGTPQWIPVVTVTSAGNADGVRPSEVRTGQRVDTIRSRREQVKETYTTTQL